jgi:DNA-binding CsgD family transcriptional regulator
VAGWAGFAREYDPPMRASKRMDIIGRRRECDAIDGLVDSVRRGASGALVIRGEAGIGKTALLDYAARRAEDCRVIRIEGVESDLGMPFAALEALCAPLMSEVEALPDPQGRALRIVLGMEEGPPPDPFVVGLATLILLSDAGSNRPLVVLVDDAQWIDDSSRQVLAFVGRRVAAEAVLLIMAVREAGDDRLVPGIADQTIGGLSVEDADALLDVTNPGGLDPRVRERIVAETGGNPLWLLELSKAMTASVAPGGIAISTAGHTTRQIEDHYTERIRSLPEITQRLMRLAAAEPTGDAGLVWGAAEQLGIDRDAAGPAADDQLMELGTAVLFRHPLVRSAAYASGSAEDRRAAHSALAAATDPVAEPALHAWHRAEAASGTDEDIASELERSAGIVQSRAGLAASAAFLDRSASMTADPERRANRSVAAAEANVRAGQFGKALELLGTAEAAAVDDRQRARAGRLRGQIAWMSSSAEEAPIVLVEAASRLEPLDVAMARETYLDGWMAAYVAGDQARPGGSMADVSAAARSAARPPGAPRLPDLFLDGMAASVLEGRRAGVPSLREAIAAFHGDLSMVEWLQWGNHSTNAACLLWDATSWEVLSEQHVQHARAAGAMTPLSIALNGQGLYVAWTGDLDRAEALIAEEEAIDEVTGIHVFSAAALLLAAYRGREPEGMALISRVGADARVLGQGIGGQFADLAAAILYNGLGRYADALAVSTAATGPMPPNIVTTWSHIERIESAARTGDHDLAIEALRTLSADTDIPGSDWAAGVEARSRALVSEAGDAEKGYTEAIDRLRRTPMRTDLARAHLLYGEWLRGEDRRVEAREALRTAYDLFSAMGAEAFAERARRELRASGEQVSAPRLAGGPDLTARELHIARLARDGRTNEEIGALVFLSPRAVDWHLHRVFSKLDIGSREELREALPTSGLQAGTVTVS